MPADTADTSNATVKVFRVLRVLGDWIPVREERATLEPDTQRAAGALAETIAYAELVPPGHQARVTVTRDATPDTYTVVSGAWAPGSPVRELATEQLTVSARVGDAILPSEHA